MISTSDNIDIFLVVRYKLECEWESHNCYILKSKSTISLELSPQILANSHNENKINKDRPLLVLENQSKWLPNYLFKRISSNIEKVISPTNILSLMDLEVPFFIE